MVELEQAHKSDRFTRSQLLYLLSKANGATLVAEEEDGSGSARVLGNVLVLFRRTTDAAHLYSLTVDPDYRGRGIGRLLLARAEEIAAARGLGSMQLEVRSDNDAAIRLYRGAGYQPSGVKAGYYSDGCDAISMVKSFALDSDEGVPQSSSSPAR